MKPELKRLVWDLEAIGSAFFDNRIDYETFMAQTAPLWEEAEKQGWTKNVMLLLAIDAH